MKFSEMKYRRPDTTAVEMAYRDMAQRFPLCATAQEQLALLDRHEKLLGDVRTMSNLAYIRSSINTNDPFYKEEQQFFDEYLPQLQEYIQQFMDQVLASEFRPELEKVTGELFFRNQEIAKKTFSPAIIPLMQEENRLATEYEQLLASADISIQGEQCNLSEIIRYQTSSDRCQRQEAWEKTDAFFAEHGQRLDEIYDALVKCRTEQAKKLGYENFVQLGYDRLGRNCYSPADVEAFREQVAEKLVPIVHRLKEKQAERLGVSNLCFWDEDTLLPKGNPAPVGGEEELVQAAGNMYREMSSQTGEFFDFMVENELFDLMSKKGKAGGGYCTDIPNYKSPFIFANFNGTVDDVEVLTHEAGHAFAAYRARNLRYLENMTPTMESAEVHSMSMELFSRPWDEGFFGEGAAQFRSYQLENCLDFIPYGTMVDEFQTRVYETPELTPIQRKELWAQLEKKYRPWLTFEGLPYFEAGGYYQWKHHIYSSPMYYIDYCLAQITALEFWELSEKDWQGAFVRYLDFVDSAGEKTFRGLVHDAGLQLPFEPGCVETVAETVLHYLEKNPLV